jgi:hypothetical protein
MARIPSIPFVVTSIGHVLSAWNKRLQSLEDARGDPQSEVTLRGPVRRQLAGSG